MWESAPRRVGISLTGRRRPAPVTDVHNRAVTLLAPDESGLARVCVAARQRDPSALTQLANYHYHSSLAGTATYTFKRAPG